MIVLDWGTSNLRGWLLDDQLTVRDERRAPLGIARIEQGEFEQALRGFADDWLNGNARKPVYAVGMVGSRNGWFEAPYVECPATAGDIARAVRQETLADGLALRFLPGVRDSSAFPFPDVIRGEETQALGLHHLLTGDDQATLVMPGTHSKWLRLRDGVIASFRTLITGELYEVLSRHSFVGQMISDAEQEEDWTAFERGVEVAAAEQTASPGLAARIFSLRTGVLAGQLRASSAAAYLSGLLIGNEFEEARRAGLFDAKGRIHLVADTALIERYTRAGNIFELDVLPAPTDLALGGVRIIHAAFESI